MGVHRLTGQSLGCFFKQEIALPLGVDLHFSVPGDRLGDCAELSEWSAEDIQDLKGMTPLSEQALFQPDVLCRSSVVNSSPWRQAEIPAVNLHGTAEGVAKVYALLANGGELDGIRLLKPETAALLWAPCEDAREKDAVFGFEAQWTLGFQRNKWEDLGTENKLRGTEAGTFGLGGIGGSSAFGSNDFGGVGFAYLTRQMGNWDRAELVEGALQQTLLTLD